VKFGIGQSVPRSEDPRLITGGGQYTDDINRPNQLYIRLLRSPYAHGLITELDVSEALTRPGVKAVYTAKDIEHLGGLPCRAALKNAQGEPAFIPHRPILADDRVLFVGQAVAAVVAETPEQAADAVEAIELSVSDLPACSDLSRALDPDTQPIHPQRDDNLCVHFEQGDRVAVDQALADGEHLVSVTLVNNRVVPSPLEPRATLAEPQENGFTIYNPSQGALGQRAVLANIFAMKGEQIRVISPDTGGGFGVRGEVHSEVCLAAHAAMTLGVPVKYTGDRSEMFLSDNHGRDNLTTVTGSFDAQGNIQGLRVATTANLGAYCSNAGPFVPTMAGGRILGSVYRIPNVHHSVHCVFTNTMPVGAYRGAGRPEACYVMERLFDAAARQMGVDAIDLRKRNFITAAEMPYRLPSGVTISSGEFADTLDLALARSDWEGFSQRAQASAAKGLLRGRGIGYYMESSGGGPEEEAVISMGEDGAIDVIVGTFSHGQGHRTTYAQILSETLGVDFECINIIQGDTDVVAFGGGTGGSRSSQMGGVAVKRAGLALVDEAKTIAAELMQSPVDEVDYADGLFSTLSKDVSVSLQQVAQASMQPQFGGRKLAKTLRYDRGGGFTFPNGAHIAEVEIDPDTGVLTVDRYTAVDDCGRVINPMLATGQVHGGVAMGIGQALYEHALYDDDGQLISGSLMDYAMPRAGQMMDMDVGFNEVLDPNNDLGVKGIGEGGACAAPSAVVLAAIDALSPLGISALDMPMTPERLWRAMKETSA
jgi:carbon-monoxide dehydrogenase large subunit